MLPDEFDPSYPVRCQDKLPGEPVFAGSLNGKPWEQREFRETLTVLFKYGKKPVWQACEK